MLFEFLYPSLLWLGALAIPLIVLYLLKAKRDRREVSATWLWAAVQQDLESRVPFRRLRRDWLLLLQLLILLLLVLAAAGPFRRALLAPGQDAIVVVDVSASLQTPDRTEALEDALREIVDGLGGGDRLAWVRAGAEPEATTPLTDDRDVLLAALPRLRPAATPSDLAAAVELAARLVGENGGVVVLTDAGAKTADFASAAQAVADLQIRRLGSDDPLDNVGVVALGVRASDASQRDHQVFVRLLNSSPKAARGTLRLLADGALRDAASLEIPADAEISRTLRLAGLDRAELEVEWKPETPDALEIDNRAVWVLRPPPERRYRVLGDADPYLRRVLAIDDGWSPADPGRPADLEILVGAEPSPDGPAFLWIDPPAPIGDPIDGSPAVVLRWERTHPALRFVDLRGVRLGRAPAIERPPGASVLASSSSGPMILEGRRDARRFLLWAFDPLETDLPGRVAFPLLVRNALEHLVPERGPFSGGTAAGRPLSVPRNVSSRPSGDDESPRLIAPSGREIILAQGGVLHLPPLEEVGVWRLLADEQETSFAVSLLSPEESDLRPREASAVLGGRAAETAATQRSALRGLWRPLAFLALILLLFESAAFHRRWSL